MTGGSDDHKLARDMIDGNVVVRPRWPLDPTAVPALGGGRHGAKA